MAGTDGAGTSRRLSEEAIWLINTSCSSAHFIRLKLLFGHFSKTGKLYRFNIMEVVIPNTGILIQIRCVFQKCRKIDKGECHTFPSFPEKWRLMTYYIYPWVVVFKFERMRTEANVSFMQCKGTV